jgi:hypothetical protein
MESIKNWDGQVIRGVTFGPKQRQGINRIFLVRAENKAYKPLTEYISYPTGF